MKKQILIACLLCVKIVIYSQETITTSGGEATGSGGTSSYSVGQIVYTTHTGASGSISQGVQQSVELFTLSNPDLTTVNLTAVTYPNPTSNYVVLAISDANLSNLSYILYDLQGRIVTKGLTTQANTQIDMHGLANGTYVLKVNQNSQELKTFKIIKK
jgi:hypothetical protein